jgi:hypothetical protein
MAKLKNNVCLTFDVDWASEEMLCDVIQLLEKYNCKATFFATHKSKMIESISSSSNFEIGLHPNFNSLLLNQSTHSAKEILVKLKKLYPAATSIRSHSLVNGTFISQFYKELGINIDGNIYIPFDKITDLKPWYFWNGIKIIPFHWSDYIDFVQGKKNDLLEILEQKTFVKTVAFHPVHIFINTSSIADYEEFKKNNMYKNSNKYGVRNILILFLEEKKKKNIPTFTMKEISEKI